MILGSYSLLILFNEQVARNLRIDMIDTILVVYDLDLLNQRFKMRAWQSKKRSEEFLEL